MGGRRSGLRTWSPIAGDPLARSELRSCRGGWPGGIRCDLTWQSGGGHAVLARSPFLRARPFCAHGVRVGLHASRAGRELGPAPGRRRCGVRRRATRRDGSGGDLCRQALGCGWIREMALRDARTGLRGGARPQPFHTLRFANGRAPYAVWNSRRRRFSKSRGSSLRVRHQQSRRVLESASCQMRRPPQ